MEVWFRLVSFSFRAIYFQVPAVCVLGEYTHAIMPRFQWCEQTRHCCRGFLKPQEEKQTTVDLLKAYSCIHMHLIIIDSIVCIDSQQQKFQSFVLVPSFTDFEATYQHQRLMFYYQIKAQWFIIKHQSSRSTSSTLSIINNININNNNNNNNNNDINRIKHL